MVTVHSIDALAHRAELEAEVLRAVSHLPPDDACQFLIDLLAKIRRSYEPAERPQPPPKVETQPAPAEVPPGAPLTSETSQEVTAPPIPLPRSTLRDPPTTSPAPSPSRRPVRTEVILRTVRERGGEVDPTILYRVVAEVMGERNEPKSKSRTASTIWQMVHVQRTLHRDEITGRIRVAA